MATVHNRDARWFVFKPKIQIWEIFVGVVMEDGHFYRHLVYYLIIWYIFPRFGILYQEKFDNPGAQDYEDFPRIYLLKQNRFAR
jgi:hypothetical protein